MALRIDEKGILYEAAELIEDGAHSLKECSTTPDGRWDDPETEAKHASELRLADKQRAIARENE